MTQCTLCGSTAHTTTDCPMRSPRDLLRRARQLFAVDYIPEHINRANRKRWVRSVLMLGDRWVCRQPVPRVTP